MTDILLEHRGRSVRAADLETVRAVIAAHPLASRRELSKRLCEAWDWRQANGQLRDMVCRSLMLLLHRQGLIRLPEVRCAPPNNILRHRAIGGAESLDVDRTPIGGSLAELGPLEFRLVRRTAEEALFNALIAAHHYLGYVRPVGEHLKYMIFAGGRPLACLAWSSAPRHLGPRDRFIGWSAEARRRNTPLLAYNTRFLVLPWVTVPHLASHLLGRCVRRISRDWETAYGHGLVYLETFTDPARFRGTCYRAANWLFLGKTSGLGNNATTRTPRVPVKEILGYPLDRRFREILGKTA